MDAKIATISIFPKIILLSLIKIAGCSLKIAIQYLKISVRYLKISGLKIAVHSLKIAGLKIIARVCVCMCVYVCARCTPILLTLAKLHRMHPEPERLDAGAQQEHNHRSDHHKSRSDWRNTSTDTEHKHQSDHRKKLRKKSKKFW